MYGILQGRREFLELVYLLCFTSQFSHVLASFNALSLFIFDTESKVVNWINAISGSRNGLAFHLESYAGPGNLSN